MHYGEKLKSIKAEKHLTNAEIAKICNVPLPTVTRVFDEKTLSGNFETFVSIARGLGLSLDELAGLKHPDDQPISSPILETFNSYSELLKEKDERIKEKDIAIGELISDKNIIRKEKYKLIGITLALGFIVAAMAILLIVDILNGHFGYFIY